MARAEASEPELFPEEIGDYRLQEHLGQGGMGVVFRAVQKSLNRPVALKLLKPGQAGSPEARKQLFREARAASRLDHPGICPIYEIGEAEGIPYLAMRYLEGQTLADRIRAARAEAPATTSGRRPAPPGPDRKQALELILLLEQAARAVHAAHEAGLVHRDLKPANLMITEEGKPVIMDFGLAREEKVEPGMATLAQGPLGTPTYMPPEQLEERALPADRRTDVYALGVTLYEALTLRPPFEAPTWVQLYQKIRTGDYPDPLQLNPRLPRDIKGVLAAAMEMDPARRYQSAEELAEDLRRVRLRLPIAVRPTGPLVRLGRWSQRNPLLASSLLALFLLLAAGLAVSLAMLDVVQHSLTRTRALGLASTSAQLLESDPIQALLLAREGARLSPEPAVLAQLLAALQESRERAVIQSEEHWVVSTVQLSPTGEFIAAATAARRSQGKALLYDLDGKLRLVLDAGEAGEPEGSAQFITLAFSPDGERLATLVLFDIRAHSQNTRTRLALWDLRGNRLMSRNDLAQHATRVAFTRDGNGLLLLDPSGFVRLLDLEGREIGGFPTLAGGVSWWHQEQTTGLLFACRGKGTERSCEIGLWDESGRMLFQRAYPEERIHAYRFAPGGALLGLISRQRALVLDQGGAVVHEVETGPLQAISCLDFSPDGRLLALGFKDGQASLHTVGGKERVRWAAHPEELKDLAFCPSGERLLSASKDRRARLWSLEGKQLFTLHGHEREVSSACFTPDGARILTRSMDRTLRIWDVAIPGMPSFPIRTASKDPVEFRSCGTEVLSIAPCGSVRSWDLEGRPRLQVGSGEEPALFLWASPADGAFLTGHHPRGGRAVRLWDADGTPVGSLDARLGPIFHSAFTAKGDRFLTSSNDGAIQLWDLECRQLARLQLQPGFQQIACLSPAGDEILTATMDPNAKDGAALWDLEQRALASYPHPQKLIALCFSPDGRHVLTGDERGAVRLWTREGELEHRFEGRGLPITALCFSPSGRQILATSSDRSARLWEARSGRLLMRFEETDSDLRHAEFSPEGSRFLTASPRTVRIWDLASRRQVLEIRSWKHGLRFLSHRCARFCPTGERILTIHMDGMVQVWPATPEAALALADRRAHRPLSPAERERNRDLLQGE